MGWLASDRWGLASDGAGWLGRPHLSRVDGAPWLFCSSSLDAGALFQFYNHISPDALRRTLVNDKIAVTEAGEDLKKLATVLLEEPAGEGKPVAAEAKPAAAEAKPAAAEAPKPAPAVEPAPAAAVAAAPAEGNGAAAPGEVPAPRSAACCARSSVGSAWQGGLHAVMCMGRAPHACMLQWRPRRASRAGLSPSSCGLSDIRPWPVPPCRQCLRT